MGSILLIDDDSDFTDAATIVLEKRGHEVKALHDTDGAIEVMSATTPDVVVLDVDVDNRRPLRELAA